MTLQEWRARNPISAWRKQKMTLAPMTREALAEALKCSIESVRDWETGRHLPIKNARGNPQSGTYLEKLAGLMGRISDSLEWELRDWYEERPKLKENGNGKSGTGRGRTAVKDRKGVRSGK